METTRGWNETRVLDECAKAFGARWKVNAFYDYATRLYLVGMFLTESDRMHRTPHGTVAETAPWLRAQRIFGWGDSWEEACYFLRLGKPMGELPVYVGKFNERTGALVALIGPGGIVQPFDRSRAVVPS